MKKSNTGSFAQTELDILVKSQTDPDNRPIIEEFIPEIIALVDKFGKSGQSGGSAGYTAGAISSVVKKLCMHEPISPITGDDDEWNRCEDMGNEPIWQNRRCSALFKNKDNICTYSDAIIWKTQTGSAWSGTARFENGEKIRSTQEVKSFPFEPKTFIINVVEKELKKDDWEFYIEDESQLEDVCKIYKVKNKKIERDNKIGTILEE